MPLIFALPAFSLDDAVTALEELARDKLFLLPVAEEGVADTLDEVAPRETLLRFAGATDAVGAVAEGVRLMLAGDFALEALVL